MGLGCPVLQDLVYICLHILFGPKDISSADHCRLRCTTIAFRSQLFTVTTSAFVDTAVDIVLPWIHKVVLLGTVAVYDLRVLQ